MHAASKTPEALAKLSVTLTGAKKGPPSRETRAKISAAMARRGPASPEAQANISAGLRAWRARLKAEVA
jgi:hypothetical protein